MEHSWMPGCGFPRLKGVENQVTNITTVSHGSHPHHTPVLLSIRTGIMQDDTASKDSDSLIHESYQYSPSYFDPDRIWWKHPRVKENWKVVATAFALVIIGLGLLVTGITVLIIPSGGVQGLVFLIIGVICFIPGAYHIVYIYLAVKGRKGYNFYHLPLFN
ncbi:transmembrane protein 134-like isoform X2 [Daphnia pulex]|uniref:transmembrane protein 134-like isoform X2 n=1 Tax=Daphnia pulex TaxID=6669 RepID=UPI001EDE0272|nr:transmembrane protein 134-like isoform X2 [Daphnia pulex]